MIYGSVCSGIEAATVAWHPLGWRPAFFSDIEAFPRAVLAHHYPDVPCHGDFTTISEDDYGTIDLLVGGTPCQAFSIAGLRKGFSDDRGNLTLEFIRLVARKKPRWVVWENVPCVLSQDRGRAFAAFLGGLAECGYGFAYRILDAQYFGVPQRRRRVFVVGYLGDWRPAAAVLFERESLRGDITPSREKGEDVATGAEGGAGSASGGVRAFDKQRLGEYGDGEVGSTLSARDYKDATDLVAALPHAFKMRGGCEGGGKGYLGQDDMAFTVSTWQDQHVAVTIPINSMTMLGRPSDDINPRMGSGIGENGEPQNTLSKSHHHAVFHAMQVRRLTPRECERLQGFPDDYTLIPVRGKPAADGPRYKALGNSMAVPVMRWLGERIQYVDDLLAAKVQNNVK